MGLSHLASFYLSWPPSGLAYIVLRPTELFARGSSSFFSSVAFPLGPFNLGPNHVPQMNFLHLPLLFFLWILSDTIIWLRWPRCLPPANYYELFNIGREKIPCKQLLSSLPHLLCRQCPLRTIPYRICAFQFAWEMFTLFLRLSPYLRKLDRRCGSLSPL